jgi:hypothetical protein
MKDLEIVDDIGHGNVLVCEMHFKKHYAKIAAASTSGVSIIIKDTKKRGCRFCKADKSGFSPWCGVTFKIWKGFKEWERSEGR